MFSATWWGIGNNYGSLNISGDTTRYRVVWGDGSGETIRTDQDDDGDDFATTAYGHAYESDGVYDVAVHQAQAGLPPIRLRAFMFGRETDAITIGGSRLDDIIVGGSASDTLKGAGGRDTIAGNDGNDRIVGGDGDDFLLGGTGDDTVRGDAGSDLIGGNEGADRIGGGDDADYLYGDDGNDDISGDAGDDYLVGGMGADRLTGGAGRDVFSFSPGEGVASDPDRDVVVDFVQGDDTLDVGDWADAMFSFIGTGAFSGSGAPELRTTGGGSNTVVLGDADGNGTVDFSIKLQGVIALDASDFWL